MDRVRSIRMCCSSPGNLFFACRGQLWDVRWCKPTPWDSDDFRHKLQVPLWLNHGQTPVWLGSQVNATRVGWKTVPEGGCNLVAGTEGRMDHRICRKLGENGSICDAVDGLEQLVRRGYHVPSNTFYRLIKKCIQDKDLAMGIRIHDLTLKSGYEGDAFLATHFISLYASHGKLEEAKRVFRAVSTLDVYTWAAIIFAYSRNGEAVEAIRLYRQMCDSTTIKPDNRIYSAVLKACTAANDLAAGKGVHAHILASSEEPDRFVQAGLIDMYAKCGGLEDARRLFDKLSHKNVVTWTTMIAGLAQQGMGQQALDLYKSMQQEGITSPNCVTYACLLQACTSIGALAEGRQLHAELKERGLEQDVVLGGSLVDMYAKCGSPEDARQVFDNLPDRNVVTWTAMIAGYVQQEMGQEALDLHNSMKQDGLSPNAATYTCLLQACSSVGVGALHKGKQLQAEILEQGLQEDSVLGVALVKMYAKCGSLNDARKLFDKLPGRNVVAWTAMIAGYSQQGMGEEALRTYKSMRQEGLTPNSVTYVCLLQACASVGVGALEEGKRLHADILEQGLQEDLALGGSLVNMYAKCGSINDATRLFHTLSERNIVAWNAMITAYAQEGRGQEALRLYRGMQSEGLTPDSVTHVSVLQACASVGVGALEQGKQMHAQIGERGLQADVVLGGSLVNMYAKCGMLKEARSVFDKLSNKSAATWNALFAGYLQQGMGQDALNLYRRMQQEGVTAPSLFIYECLLQACANVGPGALGMGKELHMEINEQGLQNDLVIACSLVSMYAKCCSLEAARSLFDKLPEKDVVTWTTMIAAYSELGLGEEALWLYSSMQQEGLTPTSVTYVCLLQACASLAALPVGEKLHAEMNERNIEADGILGAALVNMYAKCGSMHDSQLVFNSLSERTLEAWGALVSGYARQGDCEVVFNLFDRMKLEGIEPDEVTFLGVLTVCSHVGLVDKGREYFQAMEAEYGISASIEHYVCMVDLLGRGGRLEEALQMVKTMLFQPNSIMWHTLLGACRKWKDVEIGQQAFKGAILLDKKDAASYVLMSNIYASTHMWEAAKEMQAKRKELGAWKKAGQSWWTDMGGVVHTFLVGDKRHFESEGIYAKLDELISKIKKEGYVPHLESSLHDMSDIDKEAGLCEHSEKLAIACALNKTAEGTTIRIVKNLRMCEDCHTVAAHIAKLEKRTIICRDASRFHVFKEGQCSCGEFW